MRRCFEQKWERLLSNVVKGSKELHQPKSGTGVRAEKRRDVSFKTTSTKAFPVEDQPQMLLITLLITLRGYS
jgi:hypothetical protein